MRMLNQLVQFSTVPLFFLDLAISSHCFSNSGSSSVSIMAWNVSLNAQALWRMARPESIYNIDIQQDTICTCTSLNNTIPKQKTFAYKIINKMSVCSTCKLMCVQMGSLYMYTEKKSKCAHWLCPCLGCTRGHYYRSGPRPPGTLCLSGTDACLS